MKSTNHLIEIMMLRSRESIEAWFKQENKKHLLGAQKNIDIWFTDNYNSLTHVVSSSIKRSFMPTQINGKIYYRTQETCEKSGISRATLFRWLKNGVIADTMHKDRRGWRLFTEEEIIKLTSEANKVIVSPIQKNLFK